MTDKCNCLGCFLDSLQEGKQSFNATMNEIAPEPEMHPAERAHAVSLLVGSMVQLHNINHEDLFPGIERALKELLPPEEVVDVQPEPQEEARGSMPDEIREIIETLGGDPSKVIVTHFPKV